MLLPVASSLGTGLRFPRAGVSMARPGGVAGIKTISIPLSPAAAAAQQQQQQQQLAAARTPTPRAAAGGDVAAGDAAADRDRHDGDLVASSGLLPLPTASEVAAATAADDDFKARKAAAAREKRKRKNEARKAAKSAAAPLASTAPARAAAAASDDDEDADEAAAPAGMLDSQELVAASLTDSGTASSDDKASGTSTPASSHGYGAPPHAHARPLSVDWAAAEALEGEAAKNGGGGDIAADGRQSSASRHSSAPSVDAAAASAPAPVSAPMEATTSAAARLRASSGASRGDGAGRLSPTVTPRSARFWSHDERSEAAGRASSPFGGTGSDGGWQEVTKQPRAPKAAGGAASALPSSALAKGKQVQRDGPKSSWGRGNYVGTSSSGGMRAWPDEEADDAAVAQSHRPPVPSAIHPDFGNRPPEPPWTARSPVPYLFNVPGSRSFVDDVTRKRTVTLRIQPGAVAPPPPPPMASASGSGGPPPPRRPHRGVERTVVSTVRTAPQAHPHPLAAIDEPVRVCVGARAGSGRRVVAADVPHPASERKRRADEAAEREARDADAEQRRVAAAERAATDAAASAAAEEQQRRLERARQMLAAAMPAPEAADDADADDADRAEPKQPSGVVMAAPASSTTPPLVVDAPALQHPQPTAPAPAGSPVQELGGPLPPHLPPPHLPPHMVHHAAMPPPGPFYYPEGMGPPGLWIFDPTVGMPVPIDPAVAAQLFPPGPPPGENGMPPASLPPLAPPMQPQSQSQHQAPPPPPMASPPVYFAPARTSKAIEIRAPTPGQAASPPAARRDAATRRQQSLSNSTSATAGAASRAASQSPRATRNGGGGGGGGDGGNAQPTSPGAELPPAIAEEPERVIPGSFSAGGAMYFNAPAPLPGFFFPPGPPPHSGAPHGFMPGPPLPPPPAAQQALPPPPTPRADFVDPAILSIGSAPPPPPPTSVAA